MFSATSFSQASEAIFGPWPAPAPAPAATRVAAAAKAAVTAAKVSLRQSRPAGKSGSGWRAKMGLGRAHVTEELQAEAEHHL